VVKDHVQGALKDIGAEEMKKIIIAYEPVWAIGTGRTATPDQAQEVHGFIRQLVKELYNQDVADIVRIQYGGSIKPDNIVDLMAQPDVDGGLVGGASLKLDSFVKIVTGSKK
jgi:triosephosphate isomerase